MYWLDDVLVSLTLVVDGAAVTKAITWGLGQGRQNFPLVVISHVEVILEACWTVSPAFRAWCVLKHRISKIVNDRAKARCTKRGAHQEQTLVVVFAKKMGCDNIFLAGEHRRT
jgi:hypothetical protein